MINCLMVGLGGFIGAVLRYLLGLIPLPGKTGFPFMTLLINLVGSFAIGFIAAAADRQNAVNEKLVLFLKVGVCGGFTTFSTFALESANLFSAGRGLWAALYIALSVLLCLCGALCGRLLFQKVAG